MKNDKIVESWSRVDPNQEVQDRILNEILKKNDESKKYDINILSKMNLKRRIITPITMGVVAFLLLGGVTVYARNMSKGKVVLHSANSETNVDTDVEFQVNEDIRIEYGKIQGEITNCSAMLKKQYENYDPFSSVMPDILEKKFDSIDEAIEYVGYDELIFPHVEYSGDSVVSVDGNEKGEILKIQVRAENKLASTVSYQTAAILFTEKSDSDCGVEFTSYSSDFEGASHTTKVESYGDREFYIVNSTEYEDGWLNQDVYLIENKVIYELNLHFKNEDQEKANQIMSEWMKSF